MAALSHTVLPALLPNFTPAAVVVDHWRGQPVPVLVRGASGRTRLNKDITLQLDEEEEVRAPLHHFRGAVAKPQVLPVGWSIFLVLQCRASNGTR